LRGGKKATPPIIEGVKIGTKSAERVSFVSRGQAIEEPFELSGFDLVKNSIAILDRLH
jgi:hypothetical protein